MGLAIFFTLLPLSSYENSKTVNGTLIYSHHWQMARNNPGLAVVSVSVAILCWVGYFVLRRRLRSTSL
jgi:hypothetical protein